MVATAIHDGHSVREEVGCRLGIDELQRLREEDPHTGLLTQIAPTHVIGLRSRFEVDLNRHRETAVYRSPEDAWGLDVWQGELPEDIVRRSQAEHDAFYQALAELYGGLDRRYGRFVVYDLHSYNHMREGPTGVPADPAGNPQVNIGTGTLEARDRFAPVIERFTRDLSDYDFPGGRLDVRENVRFRGGYHARWTHETFPNSGCVLAVEFKKFFMDEWTGALDPVLFDAVRHALASTVPGVLEELAGL